MENILKKLFDYQKFEKNKNLERIIIDSKDKYSKKLSDDALYYVNAAGDISKTNSLKNKTNNPNGIKYKPTSLSEGDCFVDDLNNRYRVIEDYQDIEMGTSIKVYCIDIPWLNKESYNNLINYKYVGKNVF